VRTPVEAAGERDRPLAGYGNDPRGASASEALGPALRQFARERMPDYMVPAQVVVMPALPLTQNGKVDRDALPAPGDERPDLGAGYVAPRTESEAALAEVVSEVLRIDHVGVHDNLFDVGADSMLVFQISAKAQRQGLGLTPRQFFRYQTIAELAQAADEAASTTAAAAPEVEASLRERVRNMSPEEVRRLLYDRLKARS
jgi:aryl carrier-like protein